MTDILCLLHSDLNGAGDVVRILISGICLRWEEDESGSVEGDCVICSLVIHGYKVKDEISMRDHTERILEALVIKEVPIVYITRKDKVALMEFILSAHRADPAPH